ncbi:hypothetical protein [Labrys neptuniae]|uniref:SGNH/GDSL hydrolase family protein n=1 Tax=Labrys neptuniae TaxID=376174 RepID=A0ABV3PIT8_9HYPH
MSKILKTSQNRSLLIVGHSHSTAIHNAASHLKRDGIVEVDCDIIQLFGRYPDFSNEENGEIVYNASLIEEISKNFDKRSTKLIAFPLYGSEYYMICFPNTTRQFDIMVPGHDKVAKDVELVPFEIVYEMAREKYKKYIGIIPYIQNKLNCEAVYILPPPPTESSTTILNHIAAQSKDIAQRYASLTSGQLYNSWLTYARAAKDICKEQNIRLFAPPARALTSDGYLQPHLVQDAVHGNIHYGAMVFQDLIDHFFDDNT